MGRIQGRTDAEAKKFRLHLLSLRGIRKTKTSGPYRRGTLSAISASETVRPVRPTVGATSSGAFGLPVTAPVR